MIFYIASWIPTLDITTVIPSEEPNVLQNAECILIMKEQYQMNMYPI